MLGAEETMALLAEWGLALESAKGSLPRITEAAVEDVHTRAGHHETIEPPYPEWVPAEVTEAAQSLPVAQARRQVAAALE